MVWPKEAYRACPAFPRFAFASVLIQVCARADGTTWPSLPLCMRWSVCVCVCVRAAVTLCLAML
ncbi:hypothetical protein HKD37_U058946 [Glycine soja]